MKNIGYAIFDAHGHLFDVVRNIVDARLIAETINGRFARVDDYASWAASIDG